ncbi:hypothetical protein BDQ12DRAFT_739508 [Crucibulum laeve]|uniref:Uncharacterized protein n=1 Tax=Crucibulum laeve TaxID=68775 RepID=A0A5C3LJ84_9AGAR|nr:hypothetical protein BDQ12DRAFT_739508 [Crucibulum laeve]
MLPNILRIAAFAFIAIAMPPMFGAISLLTGNAILREAGHSDYTTDIIAALIGAVGGVFAGVCCSTIRCLFICSSKKWFIYIRDAVSGFVFSIISGVIGFAILTVAGHALGGINVQRCIAASVVGGLLLAVVCTVLIPILTLLIMLLIGVKPTLANEPQLPQEAHASRNEAIQLGRYGV